MTDQERADELERRIRPLLDGKRFALEHTLTYVDTRNNVCTGCALGAAAYVLSNGDPGDRPNRDDCHLIGKESDLGLTFTECYQLEMGFEAWTKISRHRQDDKFNASDEASYVECQRENPFYQLGKKLNLAYTNDGDDDWYED